jgi:hypothetical protein
MADYSKLREELTNDPLERGYSGMSDAEAAADLNTKYRTRIRHISSAELLTWAGGGANDTTGVRSRYERIEANGDESEQSSRAVRGACKAAVKMVERSDTYLDFDNAAHAAMVDGLVAGNVLTSDEKDELIAMGTESISRAAELGIGNVLPGYVTKARA